jgi:hypothetical protein
MCRTLPVVAMRNNKGGVVDGGTGFATDARVMTARWSMVSGVPTLASVPSTATVRNEPAVRWATPTVAPVTRSGPASVWNSGELGPASATASPTAVNAVLDPEVLALRNALSSIARSLSSLRSWLCTTLCNASEATTVRLAITTNTTPLRTYFFRSNPSAPRRRGRDGIAGAVPVPSSTSAAGSSACTVLFTRRVCYA